MQSFEKFPAMYTIQADPERYIKTTSFTIVSIIKILEGIVAIMWTFRLVDHFSKGIPELAHPLELFTILLPSEISSLFVPAELPAEKISTILFIVCAVAVLILLISTAVEAIVTLILRFFMSGAKAVKWVPRIVYGSYLALFICAIANVLLRAYQQIFPETVNVVNIASDAFNAASSVMNGGTLDASEGTRLLNELNELGNAARTAITGDNAVLIVSGVIAAILFFLVSYRWGMIKIAQAVEYEFRLGFKELGLEKTHTSRDTLLLGIIFIAAAVVSGIKLGPAVWYIYVIGVIGIKFFFAYGSWGNFQLCHT